MLRLSEDSRTTISLGGIRIGPLGGGAPSIRSLSRFAASKPRRWWPPRTLDRFGVATSVARWCGRWLGA